MQVSLRMQDKQWAIVPLEGKAMGKIVALAEGVSLSDAYKRGDAVIGEINATWGTTILNSNLDASTFRGVIGRSCFDFSGTRTVRMESFRSARTLIVMGRDMVAN